MGGSQKVIAEVDSLVESALRLSGQARMASGQLGPECVQELSSVAARTGQLIRRLYGVGSQYDLNFQALLATRSFTSMHSNHWQHVGELAGILQGVQHDLQSGMLDDLRLLLQGEIFADFLEMAEHLLDTGYKDASAVLLGAVMEDTLRKLADSAGISTVKDSGKPLTIDPLNVALAKAGVYNPLVQKQVTTWANLRNDAAHGNFTKYDDGQVRQMLVFVQKFCSDYLE